MSRIIKKRNAFCTLGLGVLLSSCFSGCAVSPLDYETTDSASRRFAGFTTRPQEEITIQVERLEGGWETLVTTRSSDTALPGFGDTLYYHWSAAVEIPEIYWENVGYFEDAYYHGVKARALDSTGRVLFTYKQEVSVTELLLDDPVDLWLEKGNRRDFVYLWLKSSAPDPF